jgi:serine/threonine-protein kinase
VTSPGGFPRRFDAYVLLKPLARGGMGQLYLALAGSPGLEKPCVIKQVPPDLVAPENARRFRDEAMVALRLAHGNLVSVFDAGIHEGQIFLAMEYVDGRDLHAVWNRCADHRVPFPIDVSAYIVKELARGLAYAHAFENLQLVHRDVSPANVLLSFSGEVKLTDFGLAMSVLKVEKTAPGIIYGKVSYLAPEQARREKLDGRTDLYAAGILLWELLTGRPLFPVGRDADDGSSSPSEANTNALYRARNPDVPPPSTISSRVPPELDRIVMRALAPEREDRYPDGESLRADLASYLAETAPKTDAKRLADFLRPLYVDDVRAERSERERLIADATKLFSGALVSASVAALPVTSSSPVPTASPFAPASPPASFRVSSGGSRPGEDPRIGSTIGGRYHVRRLCGEGAMGRVYEAHHIDIGRRVAIKVLHASFHHSADLVERFRREARAASRIGHANIVDVTDSGTTADGAFYFVMEFLDGTNLEQLIDEVGPLPVTRALLITAQLTRALEAAHAADIIHRDLKPANVMLVNRKDEDDFVKVLDFGISKDLDAAGDPHGALTRPNVAIGTPIYMAPEQAAGRPANPLTDVYAVGGLLYEMLTGHPPCAGGDAMAVLARKANEDPPPIRSLRPELPRPVERLVTRALSRLPGDRHPSMGALKDDVLANLTAAEEADAPALAAPPSTGRTQAIPARARRRAIGPATIAAAVGGALALAVGALVLRKSASTPAAESAAPAVAAPHPSAPPAAAATTAAAPPPARAPVAPAAAAPATTATSWPEPNGAIATSAPAGTTGAEPAPGILRAPTAARHEAPRAHDPSGPGAAPLAPHLAAAPAPSDPHPAPTLAAPPKAAARAATDATPEAVLARGQTAFDRGDYPEAVRRGREAISAGAALGGHLLVGDAYYRLERYPDAMREYQTALALDPASGATRRRLDLARQAASRAH